VRRFDDTIVANTSFDARADRPKTDAMHDFRSFEHGRQSTWRAAVLDRNSVLRARLVGIARQGGVNVCVAAEPGPEAVEQIARAGCDVVLLGLESSDPEPLALAVAVPCPIVLFSGEASSTVMRAAHRVKAMAFLVRPIRPDQLELTIALAVGRFQDQRLLARSRSEK
jgi:AmiR/NasT family two-component response regulator